MGVAPASCPLNVAMPEMAGAVNINSLTILINVGSRNLMWLYLFKKHVTCFFLRGGGHSCDANCIYLPFSLVLVTDEL